MHRGDRTQASAAPGRAASLRAVCRHALWRRLRAMLGGLACTGLIAAAAAPAFAGSLSGQVGEERRKVMFPAYSSSGCRKGYDRYVAAGGHSAFASTPPTWGSQNVICAWSINAASKRRAEQQALKSCNEGLKKYKVRTIPECAIAASK